MKTTLLASLLGLSLLAGCESTSMTAADSRTFELPGTQARNTITVQNSPATVTEEAPYSIRGDAAPSNFNPDAYRSHGTTNGF